jgi:hypothetical protein
MALEVAFVGAVATRPHAKVAGEVRVDVTQGDHREQSEVGHVPSLHTVGWPVGAVDVRSRQHRLSNSGEAQGDLCRRRPLQAALGDERVRQQSSRSRLVQVQDGGCISQTGAERARVEFADARWIDPSSEIGIDQRQGALDSIGRDRSRHVNVSVLVEGSALSIAQLECDTHEPFVACGSGPLPAKSGGVEAFRWFVYRGG